MTQAVIFIARDLMLDPLLERVADHFIEHGHQVRFGPTPKAGNKQVFDVAEFGAAFADVDVALLPSRVSITNDLLKASPRLRAIVTPSIGLECVDVDAASDLGIVVANGATEENFVSMAESTVMWILMALYRPSWSEQVLRGQRERPAALPEFRWARMLQKRRVGLIGYGQIGRKVAQRLQHFEAQVVLADHPSLAHENLPEWVEVASLPHLLASCDVISLHASARPGKPVLIGAAELALMKPDAVLINTARGSLIDEEALYQALAQRRIAGAALDTFVTEPLPQDSPLRSLDNVMLTPHLLGHTQEMFESLLLAAKANIGAVLDGQIPLIAAMPGE